MSSEPASLTPGVVFNGRYEVVRCIRAGGMGAVYEVVHLETRRRRALKVMLPALVSDPESRERFKLEAVVAADIESEHVVETFDAGIDDVTATPFLVMELLKGEELGALLTRRGRLAPREVVLLLDQVASALDRTHAAGIVHRDLKPENLFVTRRDDGTPRIKVLDFGIAKLVAQSSPLHTTRSVGTPLYMSPEQIEGDGAIDGRADLYALGQIAFTLLTGAAYWEPEARASEAIYPVLNKVMRGTKEPASARAAKRDVTLPPAFDVWFAKCTELSPEKRFDTASDVVEELARALEVPVPPKREGLSEAIAHDASPAPAGRGTDSPVARDRSPVRDASKPGRLIAAVILGAVALGAVWFAWPRRAPTQAAAAIGDAPAPSVVDTVKTEAMAFAARVPAHASPPADAPSSASSAADVVPPPKHAARGDVSVSAAGSGQSAATTSASRAEPAARPKQAAAPEPYDPSDQR